MDKKEKLNELKEHIDECIENGTTIEAMQELKDAANTCLSDVPTTITLNQFKKLQKHINDRFNAFDSNNELDLDKCQRNVAYSIGNWYTNYNGLLLRERQKLAEIEGELKLARAKAYDNIKMSKIKYDLDARGMNIMVDGHEITRQKQVEYDKQAAYVEYLKNAVAQIGYYANGVDKIFRRVELKGRYGE
jgi:hypothetical protein